jgi:hypothetical protein
MNNHLSDEDAAMLIEQALAGTTNVLPSAPRGFYAFANNLAQAAFAAGCNHASTAHPDPTLYRATKAFLALGK